jgi:hypothetical protein
VAGLSCGKVYCSAQFDTLVCLGIFPSLESVDPSPSLQLMTFLAWTMDDDRMLLPRKVAWLTKSRFKGRLDRTSLIAAATRGVKNFPGRAVTEPFDHKLEIRPTGQLAKEVKFSR